LTNESDPEEAKRTRVDSKARATSRAAIPLLALLILLAAALLWGRDLASVLEDQDRLSELIAGAGPWGPVMVIGLTIAQVLAAPIPGQTVDFAAGYLFGLWRGTLYGWIGTVAGSMLAITLARVVGRVLLLRFISDTRIARLDRFAEGKGLLFFFLLFLTPFLPDDVACFLAGFTALPLPALFFVVAFGRLPGVITAVWVGTEMAHAPWQGWVIGVVLAVPLFYVVYRHGESIQEYLLQRIGRRSQRDLP
jgi:uncharacterized membrane protein YdjX (TVP38/TMEM64 family)